MNTTGKTLLIKKCSDARYWYAHLVGQQVPLVREEAGVYISREPAGYINVVQRKDAVVVTPKGATCN